MDTVARRQQQRFQVLKYLYEQCEGTTRVEIELAALQQALALSEEELKAVYLYLLKEGLADGTRGTIGLTHKGVLEIEAALTQPSAPTEHFPANIINIGHGSSILIQQGTVNSSQSGSTQSDYGLSALGNRSPQPTTGSRGDMDVLISWSKNRSREVATLFHDWLPKVLPGVAPWMSDKDIDKGTEWFAELQGLLGRAKLCVICVTAENVRSPWLYYETGAIATKKGEGVRVCPYLIGIEPNMLSDGPLGKWQCTVATKADTLALLRSLNKVLDGGKRHNESLLEGNFEARWPEFEKELSRILTLDVDGGEEFIATEADEIAGCNLTSEARLLLIEASDDPRGVVKYAGTPGNLILRTNQRQLAEYRNARSAALWTRAFKELCDCGLLTRCADKDDLFGVTAKGYEVADLLKG